MRGSFQESEQQSSLRSTLPKSCAVVRFLWAKDIHKEIFPVYGWKCLSRKAFHNWDETFSQGYSKVADNARPGRDVETATEASVQLGGRVEFYAAGFDALGKQCDTCINVGGGYAEK
jgi:hypothetical protein